MDVLKSYKISVEVYTLTLKLSEKEIKKTTLILFTICKKIKPSVNKFH